MLILKQIGIILLLLSAASFNCGPETNSKRVSAVPNSAADDEKMYSFDVEKRSITQPIGGDSESSREFKFVEVEVVKVINPKLHPISFEIYFKRDGNEREFLGTFSLFPSDNPGKFLVPTRGILNGGGNLILSLDLPETAAGDADLKITVRQIQLRKE